MTRFRRSLLWMAALPAASLVFLAASRRPAARRPGPPRGPADRLRAALDANGDHELDDNEMANAAGDACDHSIDNGNGRIDRQEFRPPMPPPRDRVPGRERGEAGERPPRRAWPGGTSAPRRGKRRPAA